MSKSVTLRTSDANTGRKKKTKMSTNAGARNNHAAFPTSAGVRDPGSLPHPSRRLAAPTIPGVGSDMSSPEAAPSGGIVALTARPDSGDSASSPAWRSHPDRAQQASDRPSSRAVSPAHHARRWWLRSPPTPAPAASAPPAPADPETPAHTDCSPTPYPATHSSSAANHQ